MHSHCAYRACILVRSACDTTWWWKSAAAAGKAVGTVSRRQWHPSWGGVWRKPKAKPRSDEQELRKRHTWNGRVSQAKQSPILPEFQGVSAADIWGECGNAYLRRSCGCKGVDKFEAKHSNNEPQEVSRSHKVYWFELGPDVTFYIRPGALNDSIQYIAASVPLVFIVRIPVKIKLLVLNICRRIQNFIPIIGNAWKFKPYF